MLMKNAAPINLTIGSCWSVGSKIRQVIDWPIDAHFLPAVDFGRWRRFIALAILVSRLRRRWRVSFCLGLPRFRRCISMKCAASARLWRAWTKGSSGWRGFVVIVERLSCFAVLWFWVGIQNNKNIYLPCVGWMVLDSAMVARAFIYG